MGTLLISQSFACDLSKQEERAVNVKKLFENRTKSLEVGLAKENCSISAMRSQKDAGEDCTTEIVRKIIADAERANIKKMEVIEAREETFGCDFETLKYEMKKL